MSFPLATEACWRCFVCGFLWYIHRQHLLRASHSWLHNTRFPRVPSLLVLSRHLSLHHCTQALHLSLPLPRSLCWTPQLDRTSHSRTVLWLGSLLHLHCRLLQLLLCWSPLQSDCHHQCVVWAASTVFYSSRDVSDSYRVSASLLSRSWDSSSDTDNHRAHRADQIATLARASSKGQSASSESMADGTDDDAAQFEAVPRDSSAPPPPSLS